MPENEQTPTYRLSDKVMSWFITIVIGVVTGVVSGSWGAANERGKYYERVDTNSREISTLRQITDKISDRIDAMREDRRAAAAERTVTLEEMKRTLEALLAKKD